MKNYLLALVLLISGCGAIDGTNSVVGPNFYTQVSSTCGAPPTTLEFFGQEPFVLGSTFMLIQQIPNKMCKFHLKGLLYVQNGNAISSFSEGGRMGQDCTNEELAWEETYSFSKAGNILILKSSTCETVYQK